VSSEISKVKDNILKRFILGKKYKKQNDHKRLKEFLISWYGHIQNSNSYNLKKSILKEIVK